MLKCCWIIAIALGLALTTSGQAQEHTSNKEGRAETKEQPPQTYPLPLPVNIIEDQATAEARDRSQKEASQREIDDLIAQQGMNAATQAMNDATQKMARHSYYQTWFVGIGTLLLVLTLWLTRQANRAASGAVEITKEMIKSDRAWVTFNWVMSRPVGLPESQGGKVTHIAFDASFGNTGRSPAIIEKACTIIKFSEDLKQVPHFDSSTLEDTEGAAAIGPGKDQSTISVNIGMASLAEVFGGNKFMFVYARVEYKDIWGGAHESEVTAQIAFAREFEALQIKPYSMGCFTNRIYGPQNNTT